MKREQNITVLVCGGRTYNDTNAAYLVLDTLHHERVIERVAHGGATGADALANRWAMLNRIRVCVYAPDWTRYGRGAGPIRNQRMLRTERPDLVVAFPGGAGTADMVAQARKAGVEVYEVGVVALSGERAGLLESQR